MTSWSRRRTQRTDTAEHRARRRRVFRRDKFKCQINGPNCTGQADELDHIVAVAFGGDDTDENSQTVCVPCHREKSQAEARAGRRRQLGYRRPPRHPSEGPAH